MMGILIMMMIIIIIIIMILQFLVFFLVSFSYRSSISTRWCTAGDFRAGWQHHRLHHDGLLCVLGRDVNGSVTKKRHSGPSSNLMNILFETYYLYTSLTILRSNCLRYKFYSTILWCTGTLANSRYFFLCFTPSILAQVSSPTETIWLLLIAHLYARTIALLTSTVYGFSGCSLIWSTVISSTYNMQWLSSNPIRIESVGGKHEQTSTLVLLPLCYCSQVMYIW